MNALKRHCEIELKFLVPPAARVRLAAEMARRSATLERVSLAAMYLDTADRRLARKGIVWRLRREGRRWIQTLKALGATPLERFEHEVIRQDASHDASAHAGTTVGDRLIALLQRAAADEVELGVRFETSVRRVVRRVRTRGAVVEIALDEGRLVAGESSVRIREIEFELSAGSTAAMLALAERWRKRFGLIYDPRSKSERGDRLAEGSAFAPLRKALVPSYPADASARVAFCAVFDECFAQVTRNAIGLAEGDAALRGEHVHQLRVGIRRLRSALRGFDGWAPPLPDALVTGLRALFATLGEARDGEVLDTGVASELARVGAPPLVLAAVAAGPDPADAVRGAETQQLLLALIAWRASLDEAPDAAPAGTLDAEAEATAPADAEAAPDAPAPALANGADTRADAGGGQPSSPRDDAPTFHRNAVRRLKRWHAGIAADSARFDGLDEERLHALRKRIKRQRYAVEFFAAVLKRGKAERYLKALAVIQERMGKLNDLVVARTRYQALVADDPAAWFALGWLAARIVEARAAARPALVRLAKTDPPTT